MMEPINWRTFQVSVPDNRPGRVAQRINHLKRARNKPEQASPRTTRSRSSKTPPATSSQVMGTVNKNRHKLRATSRVRMDRVKAPAKPRQHKTGPITEPLRDALTSLNPQAVVRPSVPPQMAKVVERVEICRTIGIDSSLTRHV